MTGSVGITAAARSLSRGLSGSPSNQCNETARSTVQCRGVAKITKSLSGNNKIQLTHWL